MSEVVENVSEQNSAQSKEAAAPPTETMEDVGINNVEAAIKSVPEAETNTSADVENAVDSGSKEAAEKSISPKADNKKTPVKRTPSKRMSFIERAQKESEELVKNMGGSLEIEGGRRTRSSTRGTPTRSAVASTPPPAKKTRTSPASGASTPTRGRGRGRKIDVADDANEEDENKPTSSKKKTPAKGKRGASASKEAAEDEVVDKPEGVKEKIDDKEEKVESTKSNPVADESKEASKSCEEAKETVDVVKQSEEDRTDAPLEAVVEETQSQLAADLLPTEKNIATEPENKSAPVNVVLEVSESVKSDSSMDTDDIKIVENVTEKNQEKPVETTAAVIEISEEVKEATPEPMEVDSSPNVDDDVVEISDEPEVMQESSANCRELVNNTEKICETIKENSVCSPADIVAIAKPATVADVANANEIATNNLNKAEHDLGEPKIATSPLISADNDNNTATTPQTCN